MRDVIMIDFINQHIAIGDSSDAKDYDLLKANSINAVLNVAFDLDVPAYKNIEYEKVGLIDGPGNEVTTLIASVYMLEQLLQRHDKVLVHCHAGHSRAPMVVCTYLAYKEGNDFIGVMLDIIHVRPKVAPHTELNKLGLRALVQVAHEPRCRNCGRIIPYEHSFCHAECKRAYKELYQ